MAQSNGEAARGHRGAQKSIEEFVLAQIDPHPIEQSPRTGISLSNLSPREKGVLFYSWLYVYLRHNFTSAKIFSATNWVKTSPRLSSNTSHLCYAKSGMDGMRSW
jgi:hypothetical protein